MLEWERAGTQIEGDGAKRERVSAEIEIERALEWEAASAEKERERARDMRIWNGGLGVHRSLERKVIKI